MPANFDANALLNAALWINDFFDSSLEALQLFPKQALCSRVADVWLVFIILFYPVLLSVQTQALRFNFEMCPPLYFVVVISDLEEPTASISFTVFLQTFLCREHYTTID